MCCPVSGPSIEGVIAMVCWRLIATVCEGVIAMMCRCSLRWCGNRHAHALSFRSGLLPFACFVDVLVGLRSKVYCPLCGPPNERLIAMLCERFIALVREGVIAMIHWSGAATDMHMHRTAWPKKRHCRHCEAKGRKPQSDHAIAVLGSECVRLIAMVRESSLRLYCDGAGTDMHMHWPSCGAKSDIVDIAKQR